MSKFLTSKYSGLEAYVPGEQPKGRRFVKLNTNESPFPPSESAQKFAAEQLSRLMLYPDPDCSALLAAIAENFGVDAENVIVSNGSDEVLNFAFMAYCDENTPAVFPDITYGFYKVFADLNGVPKKQIPLRDDFTIALADYEREGGTVFIANPNAPTGLVLPVSAIEELLKKNPERMVVIDEAYVDFGGESCIPLTKKYDNLLVTQTFSKSRAMAGARLGFGVASKAVIDDLKRIKYSTNPYNVNSVTAAAGVGSMLDKAYFEKCCRQIEMNRAWTAKQLQELGFTMTDSKANFLFVKSKKIDGEELYLRLKEKGVLVRHFGQERIREYNRITVGSREEMECLVQNVKEILCER